MLEAIVELEIFVLMIPRMYWLHSTDFGNVKQSLRYWATKQNKLAVSLKHRYAFASVRQPVFLCNFLSVCVK